MADAHTGNRRRAVTDSVDEKRWARAKVWMALWAVYILWGSTYLAIAIVVETMPPLLGASTRFFAAGALWL